MKASLSVPGNFGQSLLTVFQGKLPLGNIPFLPAVAAVLGRTATLLLQQIHYWLVKSGHLIDDRPFIYNTYEAWSEQLGVSVSTIKRLITFLRSIGVLIVRRHRASDFDQTNWYSIDYEMLEALILPRGSFWTDREGQNDPLILSDQKTTTTDSSTDAVVVVGEVDQATPWGNEQGSRFSHRLSGEDVRERRSESGGAIGEDNLPPAVQNVLNEVAEVAPLTPQLTALVVRSSIQVVSNALAAVKEHREKEQLRNPVGIMIKAIKEEWLPVNPPKKKTNEGWGEWFTAAQKRGLVQFGRVVDGVQMVLDSESKWVTWTEMLEQYPLDQLRS